MICINLYGLTKEEFLKFRIYPDDEFTILSYNPWQKSWSSDDIFMMQWDDEFDRLGCKYRWVVNDFPNDHSHVKFGLSNKHYIFCFIGDKYDTYKFVLDTLNDNGIDGDLNLEDKISLYDLRIAELRKLENLIIDNGKI